jgi:glycosyltransferase involved in cell wall biosynthesis
VAERPTCAVLIPAFNEASTVAEVVRVARRAAVGPVVVIDDGSGDATGDRAREAGADVLRLPENRGKGGALAAGAASRDEDVVVLLDADLTGLQPEHVRALAAPVLAGTADMTRGVFQGGRWSTTAAQRLAPQLAGQRALRRALLLAVPGLEGSRYGVEVAITGYAKGAAWRTLDVALNGVSQITKEEKHGLLRGLLVRFRMYLEIVVQVLRRRRSVERREGRRGASFSGRRRADSRRER